MILVSLSLSLSLSVCVDLEELWGQQVGSCPLALAAWLLNPREERYYQSLASHCQWARSIPHYYSPPTPAPPHHLPQASARVECKVTLSSFNSEVCAGEEVSVIHLFIYLFLILLPFSQQIWGFHHLCMFGIFYFSSWIQCNKITYGQRSSS